MLLEDLASMKTDHIKEENSLNERKLKILNISQQVNVALL